MSEVGVEIVNTEENEESGIKYLNINVSNDEVKRNPDIVRLCADAGILEYVKPKTGHWIEHPHEAGMNWEYSKYECSECHVWADDDSDYCPNCGAKMEEE